MTVSIRPLAAVENGAAIIRRLFVPYVAHMHASGSFFFEVMDDGRIEPGGDTDADAIEALKILPGMHGFLIYDGDSPVGFSVILDKTFPHYPAHTNFHQSEFYVDPHCRQKGIGRAAFLASLKLFPATGPWKFYSVTKWPKHSGHRF